MLVEPWNLIRSVIVALALLVGPVHRSCAVLLIGSPSDYDVLFPQGNEHAQAQVLFSKTTQLNATGYFLDANTCLSNHPKPIVCMKYANKFHREFARLWKPLEQTVDPYPRRQRDCEYDVGNFSLVETNSLATVFAFAIRQHSCVSNVSVSLRGGAAFEVFGTAPTSLASCSYVDHLDDTYGVICSVPVVPLSAPTQSGQQACINVTTILMYEHYDGFSEVMLDWSHLYPPLRSIVADNVQYCAAVRKKDQHNEQESDLHMQPFSLRLPATVMWFSGLWARRGSPTGLSDAKSLVTNHLARIRSNSTALTNLHYGYDPSSATAAYLYHTFRQYDTNYSAIPDVTLRTMTELSMRNPHEIADMYVFHPLLLVQGGKLPTLHGGRREKLDIRSTAHCRAQFWDARVCDHLWNAWDHHSNALSAAAVDSKRGRLQGAGHYLTAVDERTYWRNFTFGAITLNTTAYVLARQAWSSNATAVRERVQKQATWLASLTPQQRKKWGEVSASRRRLNSHHASGHPTRRHHRGHQQAATPEQERARMQFHFVGASHVRYVFDSINEYFFGLDTLRDIPRKHDELRLANLQYNFIANARHQVSYLSKLCAALQNDTQSANATLRERTHTLVFQTGAWDLSVASLRRALQDPNVGKRLMTLFDGILTGRHPCGNLRRVVWLTSMPHPVCYDDGFVECNSHRSYRINSAINALNHFYLQKLFRTVAGLENDPELQGRGSALPRLSVVDAYNIIRPRLVFEESSETVCVNHFTCRYSSEQNLNFANGYGSILVHTPGGMALVKSVMNALSIS